MIDTLHSVETPEGVELELPVAGPVVRLLAWMVDALVQLAILTIWIQLTTLLASLDRGALGLWLIGLFLIQWFYGVAFEVFQQGRTPGKRALGIQVVCDDGTPVTAGASILRNFLRWVDWLPYGYSLGMVSMLLDSSFRRLGDLAAGTLVVYSARPSPISTPPQVTPEPPRIPLEPDERRAVIAFAERAALLSEARARELASIPEPLLRPNAGTSAREQLLATAAWLVGVRSPESSR